MSCRVNSMNKKIGHNIKKYVAETVAMFKQWLINKGYRVNLIFKKVCANFFPN